MTKDKKTKIAYASVIVFLCLMFVCLFGFGLKSVLAMEGSFPPNINIEGKTAVPTSKSDVLTFLNKTLNTAIEKKPQLSISNSFDIEDSSIETSSSQALKDNLVFFKGNFISYLNEKNNNFSSEFGANISDKVKVPDLTEDDIESFECNYIFYKCSSCEEESAEPLENCEKCGHPYPYDLKYRDEYEIKVVIKQSDKVLNGCFTKRNSNEISALYENQFGSIFNVKKLNVDYDNLQLNFSVNRITDKINSLEYIKTMNVKADVSFVNEFKKLGKTNIAFVIAEMKSFNFTWPGIELSLHQLSVEPKTTNNLTAKLICDDPSSDAYIVSWSSSNENLLTVDDEGYFKSEKETGTVILTANFDFQGVTYTDTCEITIKVPVESSEINKKKIELNTGDKFELKVKVSPKDCTINTVKWYSEDSNIASVDENGVVTANSKGKTVVYSLTDDGYFKSSCEVTVK